MTAAAKPAPKKNVSTRRLKGLAMTASILLSGLICVTALALGFGFVAPIGSMVGGCCDVVAVVSGIVCFGLIDGE